MFGGLFLHIQYPVALYDAFIKYDALKQITQHLNNGQSVYTDLTKNDLNTIADKHYFFPEVLGRSLGRFFSEEILGRAGSKAIF